GSTAPLARVSVGDSSTLRIEASGRGPSSQSVTNPGAASTAATLSTTAVASGGTPTTPAVATAIEPSGGTAPLGPLARCSGRVSSRRRGASGTNRPSVSGGALASVM